MKMPTISMFYGIVVLIL